jgi:hypothetical protein
VPEPLFSERNQFAPIPEPKSDDYLPGWVRESVTNAMRAFVDDRSPGHLPYLDLYSLFRPYIWQVLEREPPGNPMGGPWEMYIPRTLQQCEWWQFYDIIEEICRLIKKDWGQEYVPLLSVTIDAILAKDGIPWTLNSGRVERRLNSQAASVIQKAHALVANPRFKGPDEQFERALGYFNKRPEPDEETCVKDAVGAVEATANIIAGTTNVQLNDLLNRKPFRSGIHPTIRQAIDKVYAYRGAAPGVAHGQVGPSSVEISDATWVLTVCAGTIVYMVDKFG